MTTIKIDREQLLEKLEAAHKKMNDDNAEWEKQDKAHSVAMEKWRQDCVKYVTKNPKSFEVMVNYNWRECSVNFSCNKGTLPEPPEFRPTVGRTWESQISEIDGFIKMLKISPSDTINMGALKNVSQYL